MNQTRAESSREELVESQTDSREAVVSSSTPVLNHRAETSAAAACGKTAGIAVVRTSPEVMMRKSLSISERHEAVDLDAIDPLTPVEGGHSPGYLEAPERNRRSRSEER